jgi:hypothetical protein
MDVRFDVNIPASSVLVFDRRDIVVDHHVDLRDIDTSSDNVGGNQDLRLAVPESVQNLVSIRVLFSSVKRRDRVAVLGQPLSDSVRRVFPLFC